MHLITFLLTLALFFEPSSEPWGVDTDLPNKKADIVGVQEDKSLRTGQRVCISMIRFFQDCISPIDGPRSSFYPSSSQYTKEAIARYGVLKGIVLGCDRLMRENKDLWVYEHGEFYPDRVTLKHNPVR